MNTALENTYRYVFSNAVFTACSRKHFLVASTKTFGHPRPLLPIAPIVLMALKFPRKRNSSAASFSAVSKMPRELRQLLALKVSIFWSFRSSSLAFRASHFFALKTLRPHLWSSGWSRNWRRSFAGPLIFLALKTLRPHRSFAGPLIFSL